MGEREQRFRIMEAMEDDRVMELDMSGLLRGDPETRFKNYAIARQHDFLTIDEIRDLEGFGPLAEDATSESKPAELKVVV